MLAVCTQLKLSSGDLFSLAGNHLHLGEYGTVGLLDCLREGKVNKQTSIKLQPCSTEWKNTTIEEAARHELSNSTRFLQNLHAVRATHSTVRGKCASGNLCVLSANMFFPPWAQVSTHGV